MFFGLVSWVHTLFFSSFVLVVFARNCVHLTHHETAIHTTAAGIETTGHCGQGACAVGVGPPERDK